MGKIIVGLLIYVALLPLICFGFLKDLSKDAIELGEDLYKKFNAWMDK